MLRICRDSPSNMERIGDLYEAYVNEQANFPDSDYFYNKISKTYGDAVEYAASMPEIKIEDEKISKLKQILTNYHESLGILTPKTKDNISKLQDGVVLAGQQATIFGGTGIIGNKISAIVNVSEISKKKRKFLVPVFLINTHDSIQPEITTIHLPNYQSSVSKAIHLPDAIDGVIANTITSNNYSWLEESLSIIRNIFSEFKSTISKDKLKLFLERTEHLLTFIRETYRSSSDLGEWMTLIWGIQANIINDWGVVFLPTSHPEIRKLTSEGYTPFLQSRSNYIQEFNRATDKIEELGFKPTTAKKKHDYSPFFYECPNDHYRINLSCMEDNGNLYFQGKCPIDKVDYSFSVSKDNIDLSAHVKNLYPRLDTNQALLQTIIPTYIRISGPGEINYNAQVIPAVQKLGFKFPLYVKYTRMLYNTPWIEKYSKDPSLEPFSILTPEFFGVLGSLAKARRKGEINELKEHSKNLGNYVNNRRLAIKKVKNKPTSLIDRFRSWQYGMYDDKHQWQEVSWPWFVMAVVTGLNDSIASYRRHYSPDTPVGGVGFINSML